MRGVKGQVTIFVILGIVLLLSFVFIISMQQDSLNKKLDAQAKNAVTDFVEVNSLNQYVSGCLDLVASDGLLLLGEQGGVLYEYQGGLTPSPNTSNGFVEGRDYMPLTFYRQERGNDPISNESRVYLEEVNRNISYGVMSRVECQEFKGPYPAILEAEATSYYPVKDLFFQDYVSQFRRHYTNQGCYGYEDPSISVSGFLGANKFPPLCSYNGSNAFDPFARISPCRPNQYDSNISLPSMQRQLESYIENNLGSCVNLSFFSQFSGSAISVNEENVEVKTTLLEPRGIIVDAYYPINVQVGDRTIIQQANFQTKLNTNVRQLYDFVSRLLIDYVRNPNFNLLDDWNSTNNRFYKESFKLFFYQAPCLDCQRDSSREDYVLTIVDDSSLLKGRPWTINTAIKQRKPVLDYMNDPTQDSSFQGNKIDFQFFANSTISLEPNGIDPELGNVTYEYYGWKEDYDTYLNWTNCTEQEGSCNLSNFGPYVVRLNDQPHRWTLNQDYISSGRISSWNTSYGDVGLHNVTVVVTDKQGKKDFQIVRILIFDLPIAVLNMSNYYDDISDEWASIEDKYFLDGSASQASMMAGGSIDSYVFWDDDEPFIISTINSSINLSNDFWNATLDFFKLENFSLTDTGSNDNVDPVEHEILLVVKQNQTGVIIQSPPSIKNVSIAQCLPHGYVGSGSGGFNPISDYGLDMENDVTGDGNYYYNVNNDDLFDSPHVCCEPLQVPSGADLGGGKFYQDSSPCFDKTFFMTLPDLNKENPFPYLNGAFIDEPDGTTNKYNYTVHVGSEEIDNPYGPLSNLNLENLRDDAVNNLFKVTMKQSCSGYRGNVCGGDIVVSWHAEECNDFDDIDNNVDNQFARCQGPGDADGVFFLRKQNIDLGDNSNDDLGCKNFSAPDSYESKVLKISSINHLGWTDNETELIGGGYCAPPRAASINLIGEISIDVDSNSGKDFEADFKSPYQDHPYTCNARCNPINGGCNYFELDECKCTVTIGDHQNSCENIFASQFELSSGNSEERYVCKNSVACSSKCESFVVNQGNKAACYCASGLYTDGDSFSESEINFNEDFTSRWFGSNSLDEEKCCVLGSYFESPGNGKICWNGAVKLDDDLFEDSRLLVSDGSIYCCEDSSEHCVVTGNNDLFTHKSSSSTFSGHTCNNNGVWS